MVLRLAEGQKKQAENASKLPVFLLGQAVFQVLFAAWHIQRSEQAIPKRKDKPKVLVEMARRRAVMDLVLRRADEDAANERAIGYPTGGLPQVVAKEIKHE